MQAPVYLPRLWGEILALCRVRVGEKLVILNRGAQRSAYTDVAACAAEAAGAAVSLVDAEDPSTLPQPALETIAASDFLLDLAFSHDERLLPLLSKGLRTLVVVEPPEILARLFPTQDDRRRCLDARARLADAKTMRVVSDAGTDFSVALGEFSPSCQYGFVDERGRWDQWPGAFVYTYADEGSANGTVVLDRGDILFPMKSYVRERVRLSVRDGFITKIEGGPDAALLREVFGSYHDPDVYAISHLGWGLTRNARWEELERYTQAEIEGQDGRGFHGNFLFSTGPNIHGGGKRSTPCHIDAPMRNCSLYLDGEPIVVRGMLDNPREVMR